MATAGFSASNYNTLHTTVLPKWLNAGGAQDIVSRATPTLWAFMQKARKEPLPHDLMIRIVESFGTGADRFQYYDTVSTTAVKGPQAARTGVANYSIPIALSMQEEWENMTKEAIANHLQIVVEKQMRSFATTLAEDLFRGSAVNTKSIDGLEQWAFATTHTVETAHTLSYIPSRYKARQVTNTVANIARTAWTSETAGGTGWENVSIDMDPGNYSSAAFAFSSGAPNAELVALDQGYMFASIGIEHPDLIVSTPRPYDDYRYAYQGKVTIFQNAGAMNSDMGFTFQNVKYQDAVWFPDEYATTYEDVTSSAAAGEDNIYIINTDYTYLKVDSRVDFVMSDVKSPQDQHAGVRHILWRGQLVSENPRTLARLFAYKG